MEDNRNVKKVIILLVILLCVSIVALGGSLFYPYIEETKPAALAVDENTVGGIVNPENTGDNFALVSADLQRTKVALYRGHSEDKSPFNILNMSPGDKEYRGYELSVTYSGNVVVRFRADVSVDESVSGHTKGDPAAKLADVLMVRVDIGGKTAYEGTLGKMPKELTHTLSSKEKTCSVINYDVYAWLPKGAGEAYQQKHLEAELCWWVVGGAGADGGGQLEDSPPTGAAFTNPFVLISAASTAFFAMILVFVAGRRRKR